MSSKFVNLTQIRNVSLEDESSKPLERGLIAAVLQRAIMDATGNLNAKRPDNPSLMRELALDWISDNRLANFTFRFVCLHLDLDYKIVRKSIYKMIREGRTLFAATRSNKSINAYRSSSSALRVARSVNSPL